MAMRFAEFTPSACVATGALRIDIRNPAGDHSGRLASVNRVTRCATHLTACMASENAPGMCVSIQMACQARTVGPDAGEFSRVDDMLRGSRLCVFATRPVTRFTGLPLPPSLHTTGFDHPVGVFHQSVKDILVARLTRIRAGVADARLCFVLLHRLRSRAPEMTHANTNAAFTSIESPASVNQY